MTTLRDSEQALCGIFQFALAATHPLRNSITITEEKYHRIVAHTVALKSLRPPAQNLDFHKFGRLSHLLFHLAFYVRRTLLHN